MRNNQNIYLHKYLKFLSFSCWFNAYFILHKFPVEVIVNNWSLVCLLNSDISDHFVDLYMQLRMHTMHTTLTNRRTILFYSPLSKFARPKWRHRNLHLLTDFKLQLCLLGWNAILLIIMHSVRSLHTSTEIFISISGQLIIQNGVWHKARWCSPTSTCGQTKGLMVTKGTSLNDFECIYS